HANDRFALSSQLSYDVCLYILFFFFFFQAEDGIRDDLVTGVQTCALPIYPNRTMIPGMIVSAVVVEPWGAHPSYAQGYYDRDNRSEERRVGKECRSRWWAEH